MHMERDESRADHSLLIYTKIEAEARVRCEAQLLRGEFGEER